MSFHPPPLCSFSLLFHVYDHCHGIINHHHRCHLRMPVLPEVALEERGVVVVGVGGATGSKPSIVPENLHSTAGRLNFWRTRHLWD